MSFASGVPMKTIRARDLHRKWMKTDREYAREFAALKDEYALAAALIAARCLPIQPHPGPCSIGRQACSPRPSRVNAK
jgi:hypothetical protein